MEHTERSETSAYKLQTPGNYPKESIQLLEHGESLKSKIFLHCFLGSIFDRSVRHINVECRISRSFMILDAIVINSSVVLVRIRVPGYGIDKVVMVLSGMVAM
jgi:hypothetical protein